MKNRKSAKDLRKEHKSLLDKTKVLETRIVNRLLELSKQHPNAIVGYKADGDMTSLKAKSLNNLNYINTLDINAILTYIESIEKYLANQQPYKQGDLFINHKKSENSVELITNWLVKRQDKIQEEYDTEEFEAKDFVEYRDNNDNYVCPERKVAAEAIEIRLYCMHKDCKIYIKGIESYNGAFRTETGQFCDLRNQGFICKKHSDENNNINKKL